MTMWQREFIHGRRFKGQEGQSLVETALTLPLLLGIGFNIINWGYLWFMVLALSAAPRMGVQYATQGGAAGKATAPPTATVRDLVWENVTHAEHCATTSTVAVQVCSSAMGVDSTTHIAYWDHFGSAFAFHSPVSG